MTVNLYLLDYQKFVGDFTTNFIYSETNSDFDLYKKFLANLTAVTANVSADEVLSVIDGSLNPPPSPLDCIYYDLIDAVFLIEDTRAELLGLIPSRPSRNGNFSKYFS